MNEEQKNIETCLAENILDEVANVPTDPQFRSLVEESFDPLQQQAFQQAGYDGYIKVAGTHQPYTFTSSVKQMKSNLILLLRRLWRFPFGRGTIRSLADMWQHYIHRLKGNPEYGIPSRLAQLTDLPSAPALLSDRDMSSGIRFGTNPLPDGMSLAQLLCNTSAVSSVTEIVDSNNGWTMSNILSVICKIFKNAETILLNCEEIDFTNNNGFIDGCTVVKNLLMPYLRVMRNHNGWYNGIAFGGGSIENLSLPNFEEYYNDHYGRLYANDNSIKYVDFPKFKHMCIVHTLYMFDNCTELLEINMPSLSSIKHNHNGYRFIRNCNKVQKVVVGQLIDGFPIDGETPDLIHFQVANNYGVSLNLGTWSPTTALSERLPEFLSNFKQYIALRLTDKGTGLTITLSQEVRNAIHAAEDEYGIENIIITKKGWTISPAPN